MLSIVLVKAALVIGSDVYDVSFSYSDVGWEGLCVEGV